jgi:hypothetical protein
MTEGMGGRSTCSFSWNCRDKPSASLSKSTGVGMDGAPGGGGGGDTLFAAKRMSGADIAFGTESDKDFFFDFVLLGGDMQTKPGIES